MDERTRARDELESLVDGPKLWRAQGRAVLVRDFLKLYHEAPQQLQRFKAAKLK